jgi:hypothetical protein
MLLGENDEPTILIVWVVAARAEDAMPKEARLRSAIDAEVLRFKFMRGFLSSRLG